MSSDTLEFILSHYEDAPELGATDPMSIIGILVGFKAQDLSFRDVLDGMSNTFAEAMPDDRFTEGGGIWNELDFM